MPITDNLEIVVQATGPPDPLGRSLIVTDLSEADGSLVSVIHLTASQAKNDLCKGYKSKQSFTENVVIYSIYWYLSALSDGSTRRAHDLSPDKRYQLLVAAPVVILLSIRGTSQHMRSCVFATHA